MHVDVIACFYYLWTLLSLSFKTHVAHGEAVSERVSEGKKEARGTVGSKY